VKVKDSFRNPPVRYIKQPPGRAGLGVAIHSCSVALGRQLGPPRDPSRIWTITSNVLRSTLDGERIRQLSLRRKTEPRALPNRRPGAPSSYGRMHQRQHALRPGHRSGPNRMFVKSLFAWLTRCTTLRPSVEFFNDILRMRVSVKAPSRLWISSTSMVFYAVIGHLSPTIGRPVGYKRPSLPHHRSPSPDCEQSQRSCNPGAGASAGASLGLLAP